MAFCVFQCPDNGIEMIASVCDCTAHCGHSGSHLTIQISDNAFVARDIPQETIDACRAWLARSFPTGIVWSTGTTIPLYYRDAERRAHSILGKVLSKTENNWM